MSDEWNEKLRCPECSKTGMASLSHREGDATPSVQAIPDGFKVVDTQYGPVFYCGACDIELDP